MGLDGSFLSYFSCVNLGKLLNIVKPLFIHFKLRYWY